MIEQLPEGWTLSLSPVCHGTEMVVKMRVYTPEGAACDPHLVRYPEALPYAIDEAVKILKRELARKASV